MTEQQKRSLFFSATGKVATLNPFEYFIFCKGMDAEREACAKVCDENANPNADKYEQVSQYQSGCYITAEYLAAAIRARGQ